MPWRPLTLAIVSLCCLTAAAGAHGSVGRQTLDACSAARASTAATVTRVGGTGTYSFSRVRRISSPHPTRSLARALCALPRMPAGVFNCPFDSALRYVVRFGVRSRTVATATVDPGGCELVQGLVHPRTVMRDAGFWHAFGVSLGLAHPSLATFRG
jgi:hypothetical protein